MPVKILVSSRKFEAQLKNGDTFTLNPSDIATHLKGSVMEKIRATHQIDIDWGAVASQTDLWRTTLITDPISGFGLVTKIVRESGDFIEDGFADGDSIFFTYNAFVKVVFDSVEIMRHEKDQDLYGVTLKQNWYSSTYSDTGWVFLLWDFKDEKNPMIYVRSWQPERFKDGSIIDVHEFIIAR